MSHHNRVYIQHYQTTARDLFFPLKNSISTTYYYINPNTYIIAHIVLYAMKLRRVANNNISKPLLRLEPRMTERIRYHSVLYNFAVIP